MLHLLNSAQNKFHKQLLFTNNSTVKKGMNSNMENLQSTTTLANGVKMPWLGLGVYKVEDGQEVVDSVKYAIKESGVSREELFVTSKVWNADQGYDTTLQAFETSLNKLGLEYLDLYLIHWPVQGKYKDTWKALEKLYKDGKIRAIGVSNFQVHHLEDLIADAEVKPMVNQIEFHPLLTQTEVREYCKKQGIQVEAWSPLAQGELLDNEVLTQIAEKHGKSTAQVILRWDLQNEVVTIPKSTKEHRIIQNADVFDFELNAEEVEKINALNQNHRVGPDPDNFDF